jgi:hypothetical protein
MIIHQSTSTDINNDLYCWILGRNAPVYDRYILPTYSQKATLSIRSHPHPSPSYEVLSP